MQTWIIFDYAIPYLLRQHNFLCLRQDFTGSSCKDYYLTNCPILLDGDYTLADGTVIQGCSGVELRIKGRLESEPIISLD